MTAIDEIKARIDIVDLVSETVQLRRTGKNYTGFCPFHPNSRTPAFVVFPETGTWRCFGQCNEGGDIFRFVMKKEGWDFTEALRIPGRARRGAAEAAHARASRLAAEEHDAPAHACSRMRSLFTATTCSIHPRVRLPWNTCTEARPARTRPSRPLGWATPRSPGRRPTQSFHGQRLLCRRTCWRPGW